MSFTLKSTDIPQNQVKALAVWVPIPNGNNQLELVQLLRVDGDAVWFPAGPCTLSSTWHVDSLTL